MVKYIKDRVRSYVSGIAKQCVEDALTEDRWSQVAEAIDTEELAGWFSVSDIASEIDPNEIACEIEVDADNLDYRRLAMELLKCVKGGA